MWKVGRSPVCCVAAIQTLIVLLQFYRLPGIEFRDKHWNCGRIQLKKNAEKIPSLLTQIFSFFDKKSTSILDYLSYDNFWQV